MRKKIFSGVFAIALLATAGWRVNKSLSNDAGLSDLALSNVEALADGESGGGRYDDCLQGDESSYGTNEFYCGTCSWKNIKKSGKTGGCTLN